MTAVLAGRSVRATQTVRPRPDWWVAGGFLLAAFVVLAGLWLAPGGRYLVHSGQDQRQWEWFFDVTAHGGVLFSRGQNFPLGVNLMANTSMPGIGLPLAPLTLLAGSGITWAVVLTGGLASTAYSWYWLFSRYLTHSRAGAVCGGAFCAFAPPVISHANAHPNFVVQFVIPLLIAQVIKLHRGQRVVANGLLLGVLAAYQVFVGEELLLLTASALFVFGLVWLITGPTNVKPVLTGLAIAVPVFAALTSYPLWWQLRGTQSYRSLQHGRIGNDLLALGGYAQQSVIRHGHAPAPWLAINPTENNGFFGWPLIVLVIGVSAWLWRDRRVKAIAVAGVVMAVLSLGDSVSIDQHDTGLPGPWRLLRHVPFYESVIQSRFTLACVPLLAAVLALGIDRSRRPGPAAAALAVALVPILPVPLATEAVAPTPAFVADGTWRHYVRPHHTLIPIPVPRPQDASALAWQTSTGLGFAVPGGYFIGPDGPSRRGVYGPVPRALSLLTAGVADSGRPAPITPGLVDTVRADLRYWRADAVVLAPQPNADALRRTMDGLLGRPGQFVDGVWLWPVSP